METRCEGCGWIVDDPDAAFCANCGMQLAPPGSEPDGEKKFCDGCGTENPGDAIFCMECGQRFENDRKTGPLGIGLAAGAGGIGGAIGTAAATTGGAAGAVSGAAGVAGSISGAGMSASALTGAASAAQSLSGAAGAAQAITGAAGAGQAITGAAGGAQAVTGAAGGAQGLAGAAGAGSIPPPPTPPPPVQPPPPPATVASTTPTQPPPSQPAPPSGTQPTGPTQAPPQPPPTQPPPPTTQPTPQPPAHPGPAGLTGTGSRIGTIITRGLTIIGIGSGIVLIGVIAASALMFTGNPAPCVNRTSTPSAAAAASLLSKWNVFLAQPAGASVQFTEAEVTSTGVSYLAQRNVPVSNLQVYFCPNGTAQAKGKVSVLGRTANVLLTGHLDISGGKNVVVIDSVKAGNLPSFVGTSVVNQVIDRNNVRNLPLGVTLTSSTTTNGTTKLTR